VAGSRQDDGAIAIRRTITIRTLRGDIVVDFYGS
jgi:hypothetical protein